MKNFWRQVKYKYKLSHDELRELQRETTRILMEEGESSLRAKVRDTGVFLVVGNHTVPIRRRDKNENNPPKN